MEQEGITLIIEYTTIIVLILAIALAFIMSMCLYKKDKLLSEIKSLKEMLKDKSSQIIKD